MLSDNLVTSERFLGSEMNPETSEPDSPRVGKSYKISFTKVLNTLCKPLTICFEDFNTSLHSDRPYLTRSRVL